MRSGARSTQRRDANAPLLRGCRAAKQALLHTRPTHHLPAPHQPIQVRGAGRPAAARQPLLRPRHHRRAAPATTAAAAPDAGSSSLSRSDSETSSSSSAASGGGPASSNVPGVELLAWLKRMGAPQDKVTLRTLDVAAAGRPLDVTVAAAPVAPGDVVLSVPDELVVTVDRIVQSEALGARFLLFVLRTARCGGGGQSAGREARERRGLSFAAAVFVCARQQKHQHQHNINTTSTQHQRHHHQHQHLTHTHANIRTHTTSPSTKTAEMLTTGKLSELAVLTLYLMYEKKVGGRACMAAWLHACMAACSHAAMHAVITGLGGVQGRDAECRGEIGAEMAPWRSRSGSVDGAVAVSAKVGGTRRARADAGVTGQGGGRGGGGR